MNPSFNKVTKGLFLACGISCAAMPAAYAEEVATDEDIEVIQVRATKRAENAKDVPMAINVTSGEDIARQGITHLEDLSASIPNFTIGDSLTTNNVYMRGMGSGADRGFEQSVSMYVNGVYMPRSRQTRASFFDVGHIEVLRGPQSVLFGLNSTAGAISIHNNKTNPGDDFHATVLAEYETEYEGVKTDLILGGSLTDDLAVRVALRESDSDGWFTTYNPMTDESETVGGRDESVARVSMVWQATDDLKVEASYENADFFVSGSIGEIYNKSAELIESNVLHPLWAADADGKLNWQNSADTSLALMANGLTADNDGKPGVQQESDNASMNLTYALGAGSELQANLGYSDYNYGAVVDVDTTYLPMWDAYNYEEYEQTSAELVYLSPTDGDFSYIVGAYYQTSDFYTTQPNVVNLAAFGLAPFLPAFGQPESVSFFERGDNPLTVDQTMMSVFFSADYNITDNLTVIAGARWTNDEKDFDRGAECQWKTDNHDWTDTKALIGAQMGLVVCSPAGYEGNSDTIESDNVMPEITVKYTINDNMSMYAKAGQSVKSGGVATAGTIDPSSLVFDDETVTGLELGFKSSFWDDAATANITVFQSTFDDLQVKSSVIDPVTNAVKSIASNAGESTTQGVELDFALQATNWLTVGANVAYLEAEYDTFRNGPCNIGMSNPADTVPETCNLSGATMPFAPEMSGNVYANFEFDLGASLVLQGGANYSYSDEYFTEGSLDENVVQDSWTKVNARIGVAHVDGTWEVNLMGNNITDEKILGGSQPFGGSYDLGYLGAPRTVSVQGVYRFGG